MKIIQTIRDLSAQLPSLLEEGFGRLGELGIDFGVDTKGRVWILEVNSKPGRRAFTLTGDGHAPGCPSNIRFNTPVIYCFDNLGG